MRNLVALASILALVACESDDVMTSGYTLSVTAGDLSGKTSAISLTNGYVNVTEVELENEDQNGTEVEIDIEGLYQFDLITGQSTPSFPTSNVPAGTYQELEVQMGDDSSMISVYLEADYTDTAGTIVPMVVTVTEEVSIEVEDEVNGIQVQPGQVSTLDLIMGINAILSGTNLTSATINNGQININENENEALYEYIVERLNVEIEVEDDD